MKKKYGITALVASIALALSACAAPGGAAPTAAASAPTQSGFDASQAIVAVSREDGSGTRGAFIELFGVEEKQADGSKVDMTTTEAIISNSTSNVMLTVSGNPYAIGYISLGSLNDTVRAVRIDGVQATVENINSGAYAIARPFNIATKSEISDLARDFIAFIMSGDGQAVIDANGYIKVADTGAFASAKPAGKLVIAGSSSVTPVMEKLVEAYKAINTGAEIELQQSDSSTGMSSAMSGVCDIGMASRDLKESELAELTPTTIAMDGIAVIVNNGSSVTDLTKEQVKAIFTGEAASWSDVVK